MRTSPSRVVRAATALAAAVVLVTLVVAGTAGAGGRDCRPVAGKLDEVAVPTSDGSFQASGRLTGGLQGTDNFRLEHLSEPLGDTTVSHFVGHSLIETRTGDIDMLVAGAFDTDSGRFSDLLTVVGGTGEWEGATGQLHLFGTFDLATGAGSSDYRGEICTAPS
ncbi:MAG: hypothetical protein ACRDWI_19675 [Jiangellaceae bacterium]